MALMVNPFRVLGLDMQCLQGLSSGELRILAQSQWRAMQRVFHPDTGKKGDRRSKEINEAYEDITRMLDEGDDRIKELLSKKGRRTAEEKRERQTAFLQTMYQGATAAFIEYLNALVSSTDERLTVFNCAPCVMQMFDYALVRYKERSWKEPSAPRPVADPEIFYTLCIDASGVGVQKRTSGVSHRNGKEVIRAMHGRLIGGVDAEVIKRHDSVAGFFKAVGYGPPERDRGRRYLSYGESPGDDFSYATVPLECVRRMIPFLTPYIGIGTALFSFQQGQSFFGFVGSVTKIERNLSA